MEATDWQEQFCGTAPHARPLSGELYLNVCISRSWLCTPLLLLSVTSWEVSEVLHSPSCCLCPLWEQTSVHIFSAHLRRGWWRIRLLSIQISSYTESWESCLIGPNVILIGSHLLNERSTLCQSPSSTSSPSVFRWGWCPWNGRGLLFSLTSCFFFYLLLGYVNGVEEMEFKMRVPSLRQQKNRSPAFVSLKGACFYFSFASQSLVGHSPAEKEVSVIHLTFSLRGGLGLMCLWVRGKNHCVSIAVHWLKQYFTCWAVSLDPFLC